MKKLLWTILIGVVVFAMIITPIAIHFLSSTVVSELSADGLLNYIGNCIASIPTIIIALVAIWQTKKANNIAEEANVMTLEASNIAQKANEISERLLELEITRQKMDLRPAFIISEWSAPIKYLKNTSVLPDDFCVQIGHYSGKIAWGLKLTLLNISSGYETITFNRATAKDGSFSWTNAMSGATSRKIGLSPSEKNLYIFMLTKKFLCLS